MDKVVRQCVQLHTLVGGVALPGRLHDLSDEETIRGLFAWCDMLEVRSDECDSMLTLAMSPSFSAAAAEAGVGFLALGALGFFRLAPASCCE